MPDVHPDDTERTSDEVAVAADTDAVTRDPDHDPTTEREAVENALQDEGVSRAGEVLGDDIDQDAGHGDQA